MIGDMKPMTGGRRRRRAVIAVCTSVAAAVVACANPTSSPAPVPPTIDGDTASAPQNRAGELGALTAHGVVEALADAGFATSHPVDSTAQECPTVQCDQSVTTDRFRITSFRSTAEAQRYAAAHGFDQVGTVVVAFSPAVPEAERTRYWTEIVRVAG